MRVKFSFPELIKKDKRQGDHRREDIFISLGNNIPWGIKVFRFIFTSEIIPKDIGGSFIKELRTRREGSNTGDTMYLPISTSFTKSA